MSWYPLAAHKAGPVPLQPGPSAPADRRGALARIRKPGAMVIRASLLGAGLVASAATPAHAASGALSYFWNVDGAAAGRGH